VTNPQGASGQASERATNPGGQAPSPNNSPAGQAPTQANNETTHNDLDDIPPERLRKMVEDLRKSEAAHRTSAKDSQAKLDEIEKANLSELERTQKELAKHQEIAAKATTENQRLRVERALDREASRIGLDPEMAARLIDWSDLTYDEVGNPKNAEKLLAKLLEKWPTLASSQQPQTGQNGQNGNGSSNPNLARQYAGGATNPPSRSIGNEPMSRAVYEYLTQHPEEYLARRSEVMTWLSKQR
jgi:hypothetical protein